MVIAYSYQELYSFEIEDKDSRGRPVKGMKRDDYQLNPDGTRPKVWYRSHKTGDEDHGGIMHVFSVKAPVPNCKGQPIEADCIEAMSEGGNLTRYMQKDYLHLLNGKMIRYAGEVESGKDMSRHFIIITTEFQDVDRGMTFSSIAT